MEKNIVRWTYWLGVICTFVAIAWRGLNTLGLGMPRMLTPGTTVWYLSFYKAALLFFLGSIASAQLVASQK